MIGILRGYSLPALRFCTAAATTEFLRARFPQLFAMGRSRAAGNFMDSIECFDHHKALFVDENSIKAPLDGENSIAQRVQTIRLGVASDLAPDAALLHLHGSDRRCAT